MNYSYAQYISDLESRRHGWVRYEERKQAEIDGRELPLLQPSELFIFFKRWVDTPPDPLPSNPFVLRQLLSDCKNIEMALSDPEDGESLLRGVELLIFTAYSLPWEHWESYAALLATLRFTDERDAFEHVKTRWTELVFSSPLVNVFPERGKRRVMLLAIRLAKLYWRIHDLNGHHSTDHVEDTDSEESCKAYESELTDARAGILAFYRFLRRVFTALTTLVNARISQFGPANILKVDVSARTITNIHNGRVLDLGRRATGWAIFITAFNAGSEGSSLKAIREAYAAAGGNIGHLRKAKCMLNEDLLNLGVRFVPEEWRLENSDTVTEL